MKRQLTEKLLRRWYEMTDNNLHSEVRQEIGKWCDDNNISYPKFGIRDGESWENIFKELAEVKECRSSFEIYTINVVMVRVMMEAIEQSMGTTVKDKIWECL